MNDKTRVGLETGMILETRNKRRGILLNGTIYWENGGRIDISNFDENLKLTSKLFSKEDDIGRIYSFKKSMHDIRNIFLDKSLELIWQRKEIDLAPDEIEILQALLKLNINFIARDKNGELFAYQNEPIYDEDYNCWINEREYDGYQNAIRIEKDFKWIENKGLMNIKEILDNNK